jgi:UDP-glucose:(heptosyl)LPS alpha-1,3-glucosyltransferase
MANVRSIAIGIRNINIKSGLGKIVYEQILHFQNQGIKVDIYTHKYDPIIKKSGAKIFKIFKVPFVNEFYQRLLFAKFAQKKIARKGYDLVIGHGDLIEQDILFLHNLVEKTYLLTHKKKMEPLNDLAKFRELIFKSQKFKLLIANSVLMKNELVEYFHIEENKIKVAYPGYDPKQFNVRDKENNRPALREDLKINSDTVLIGFITSGDFKKRALSLFIEAINKIDKNLNFKILLVGKDSNIDKYMQEIKSFGLESRFILKDPIDNVEKYFYALDFTVHPAYFEEFGMVVQEAMACGLPVITSKCVGASEIMLDKTLIMEEPNLDDLSTMIEKLILDQNFRYEISEKSLLWVTHTTWDDYLQKCDEYILPILTSITTNSHK